MAPKRSFVDVDLPEALRRARQTVPVLRERAQQCEDARVLLPENERLPHCGRRIPSR